MLTVQGIQARLGIDVNGYAAGMLKAEGITQVFGQTFGTFVTNPVLGGIQLFKQLGGAAVKLGIDVLGTAESVQRFRQETGLADETIETLRAAMERAGKSAQTSDDALLKFTDTIGEIVSLGKSRSPVLQGLEQDIISLSSNEDRFRFVIDRLGEIEDVTERAAAANDLFGRRGGAAFVNVARSAQELDSLVQLFTDFGRVRGPEVNDVLAELNTRLGSAQQAIQGVKESVIAGVLLGIDDEFNITDAEIAKFARTIREEFVPAAIETGRVIGDIVERLDNVIENIDTIRSRGVIGNILAAAGPPQEVFKAPSLVPDRLPTPVVIVDNESQAAVRSELINRLGGSR